MHSLVHLWSFLATNCRLCSAQVCSFHIREQTLTKKLCYRKDDRAIDARYINGSNEPSRRYGHSKFSKMEAGRHLEFDVTRNNAIRSADPENPTLEPNMKCIGSPVAEIWPFVYLGGIWNPHFFWGGREGEVVGCQRWQHSKERWWFPIGSPL